MIAPLRLQERTMLLADVLTLDNLRLYAGDKTFIRGRDYFNSGAVQALASDENSTSAEVRGTQRYEIVLSAGADGELEFECDCPVGEDGIFCKHAVAVGLAWIAGEDLAEPEACSPKPKSTRQSKAARLRAYVDGLSPGELRRWLLQAAEQDHDLRDRLLFAAAAQAAHDLPGLRSAIHQATRISGFLDHDDTEAHANRLQDLAGLLETRIADGDAKLVELIEEAIGLIQNGLENIDDGEGWVYGSLERFQQLHLLACEHLRPDATALAGRLVRYQMDSHWDTFSTILPDYGNARDYLNDWISPDKGWLRKFYKPGTDEAQFDLTPATEKAIAWIASLTERPFVGTGARNPPPRGASSHVSRRRRPHSTTRSASIISNPDCAWNRSTSATGGSATGSRTLPRHSAPARLHFIPAW